MNIQVESTDRGPMDYFHFGVACLGMLIHVAGIVTTTEWAAMIGLVLVAFGLAYFLLHQS
jgi:hypothetical protein